MKFSMQEPVSFAATFIKNTNVILTFFQNQFNLLHKRIRAIKIFYTNFICNRFRHFDGPTIVAFDFVGFPFKISFALFFPFRMSMSTQQTRKLTLAAELNIRVMVSNEL